MGSAKIKPMRRRTSSGEAEGAAVGYGELDHRLGYVLRRAQMSVLDDFHRRFAALDIRPAQYSVLTLIANNSGLSQTALSSALAIKKPNLAVLIAGLRRRGLVKQVASAGDRRAHALHLTEAGNKLLARLHAVAEAHEKFLIDCLGMATYRRLYSPLRKLIDL